jgi:hypothetical protein
VVSDESSTAVTGDTSASRPAGERASSTAAIVAFLGDVWFTGDSCVRGVSEFRRVNDSRRVKESRRVSDSCRVSGARGDDEPPRGDTEKLPRRTGGAGTLTVRLANASDTAGDAASGASTGVDSRGVPCCTTPHRTYEHN